MPNTQSAGVTPSRSRMNHSPASAPSTRIGPAIISAPLAPLPSVIARTSANHSTSTSAPPTSRSRAKAMPPNHSAAPAIANSTSADAMRSPRSDFAAVAILQTSEAAFAPRKLIECRCKIGRLEVGPQAVGEVKLGIGRLPQQEIRKPYLARGADEKVKRRQVSGVEMRLDRFGGDRPLPRGSTRGAHELVLRAIVERHRERRALVARGARERLLDEPHDVGSKRTPVADDLEPHVIGGKFIEIAQDEALHQPHEVADFLFGAFPVFRGKGVESERLKAEVARRAHDLAYRLHACAVAGDARQVALLGPAAVAIHDDGDVAGTRIRCRHRAASNPVRAERRRDALRPRTHPTWVSASRDANGKKADAGHH